MSTNDAHPRFSRRRSATGRGGFTLIEALITTMLVLVVLAATLTVWTRLESTYSFFQDDVDAQEQARLALGEMIEYIRTARLPASVPSEALETVMPVAKPNEIWIWTDSDRDPSHDLELVRFYVDTDRRLIRQESLTGDGTWDGAAVRIINSHMDNSATQPLFIYYDANAEELPQDGTGQTLEPQKIREVAIDLRVDIDPSRSPIVHELRSVVQPRNLRQY